MWSDSIPGAAGESAGGAGDLFTARIHGLVDLQREIGDQAAEWAERREPRAEEYTARLVVESMRSLLLLKAAELTERDEPPSIDEVAHLALALHRIEAANRHRLARDQATAETAAPPAPRAPPSTEEMRALLGPAIREAFHPERLGSKPWEPWPDAPLPAEPDTGQPEPPWDPSAGHSAWDEPMAQGEEEAQEAREESAPEGPCEAEDRDRAPERHEPDDVPHIARPNRAGPGTANCGRRRSPSPPRDGEAGVTSAPAGLARTRSGYPVIHVFTRRQRGRTLVARAVATHSRRDRRRSGYPGWPPRPLGISLNLI